MRAISCPNGFAPANMIPLVDRSVYPEADFPAGQWEYQLFYEENFDKARLGVRSKPAGHRKSAVPQGQIPPARASLPALRWCAGMAAGSAAAAERRRCQGTPDVLTEADLSSYVAALERNGFFGPDSWYMNHARNIAFAQQAKRQRPDLAAGAVPAWRLRLHLRNHRLTPRRTDARKLRRPDRGRGAVRALDGAGEPCRCQRRPGTLPGSKTSGDVAQWVNEVDLQYQAPLMLIHERWVNGARYQSLFGTQPPLQPCAQYHQRSTPRIPIGVGVWTSSHGAACSARRSDAEAGTGFADQDATRVRTFVYNPTERLKGPTHAKAARPPLLRQSRPDQHPRQRVAGDGPSQHRLQRSGICPGLRCGLCRREAGSAHRPASVHVQRLRPWCLGSQPDQPAVPWRHDSGAGVRLLLGRVGCDGAQPRAGGPGGRSRLAPRRRYRRLRRGIGCRHGARDQGGLRRPQRNRHRPDAAAAGRSARRSTPPTIQLCSWSIPSPRLVRSNSAWTTGKSTALSAAARKA